MVWKPVDIFMTIVGMVSLFASIIPGVILGHPTVGAPLIAATGAIFVSRGVFEARLRHSIQTIKSDQKNGTKRD